METGPHVSVFPVLVVMTETFGLREMWEMLQFLPVLHVDIL
jgi:hypothetical protein